MANFTKRRLTHQMQLVELRIGQPLPLQLRRCREDGLTARAIGLQLGVAAGTIRRWLVRFQLDDASLIRKALAATGEELDR
jgi:hypothetical protein